MAPRDRQITRDAAPFRQIDSYKTFEEGETIQSKAYQGLMAEVDALFARFY